MVRAALYLFAALALLNWAANGMNPIESVGAAINEIDDKINRGQRLTNQTPSASVVRSDLVFVDQSPTDLCAEAAEHIYERSGQSVDVSVRSYTMARVIRSERSPGGPTAEAIAIAWVLRNVADKNYSGDILQAATAANGKYGPQGKGGAKFATSCDPYESDYSIALSVLTNEIPDPTGGARNFVHPKGFATTDRYQEVKTAWMSKGLKPMAIEGAPMIEVFV